MPRRKNPKMVAQPHNMTHFLSPVGDMSGFNKRARTGSPAATARLRHTEEPRDSSDDSSDGSEYNDSGKSGAQPRDSIHAQAASPPPTRLPINCSESTATATAMSWMRTMTEPPPQAKTNWPRTTATALTMRRIDINIVISYRIVGIQVVLCRSGVWGTGYTLVRYSTDVPRRSGGVRRGYA